MVRRGVLRLDTTTRIIARAANPKLTDLLGYLLANPKRARLTELLGYLLANPKLARLTELLGYLLADPKRTRATKLFENDIWSSRFRCRRNMTKLIRYSES